MKIGSRNTENLNRPMSKMRTESVLTTITTKKNPVPDGITSVLYQTFQELIPILLKLLKTIEREKIFPYSYHEMSITLIPK